MDFNFFKESISEFLAEKGMTDAKVFLTDMDGYLLFGSQGDVNKSLIALIAGVYQGAHKLYSMMGEGKEIPSLSLGEGADNLFIKQITIKGRELLLSSVLSDIAYPARYKMYLKLLADNLVENYPVQENTDLPEKNEAGGFLFDNISDEEVDNLFQL